MTNVPQGEHEVKSTSIDDGFVFDHVRTDSPTFTHMERVARAAGTLCCITGQPDPGNQYHHKYIEFSLAYMVDWHLVKKVAMGEVTEIPVLDLATHQPVPGKMRPVDGSKLWWMIQAARLVDGYDWSQFDPDKPETFVDSRANMDPLQERYHIGDRGQHRHTGPFLGGYHWPRLPGVIYAPNEEQP